MLGLGYRAGAILEKFARGGDLKSYKLPVPVCVRRKEKSLTYSGLKRQCIDWLRSQKPLTKVKTQNLAACFQDVAFPILVRIY